MFKIHLVFTLVMLGIANDVESLMLRHKVCTSSELKNTIKRVCGRISREEGSGLYLSPYGSITALPVGSTSISDAMLIEILSQSTDIRIGRNSMRKRELEAAATEDVDEYIESMCQDCCTLNSSELCLA